MIVDLRTIEAGHVFQADVCIAGAGAAGLTLARELLESGVSVCLLESGGIDFDAPTQLLYEVENVGIPRLPAITRRLRYFGGTTNHWTGKCGRLDSVDMVAREWVPDSGWPITRDELDQYYDRAESVLDLGPTLSGAKAASEFHVPLPAIDEAVASLYAWQLSPPTRFGQKYRSLTASPLAQVVFYANVVNIQTNPRCDHVEYLDIRTTDGAVAKVQARLYVLSCGGIENARLMLASRRVDPRGVGNANDLVGRYFMEHIRTLQLIALDKDPYSVQRVYNTYAGVAGSYLLGMSLSESIQRRDGLLNGAFFANFDVAEPSATDSASALARSILSGQWPSDFRESAMRVMNDLDELVINFRRKLYRRGSRNYSMDAPLLVVETEQAPNRDSRISLSSEMDALGQPLAKVDWRMGELDRRSVMASIKLFAGQLWLSHKVRIHLPEAMENSLEHWVHNFQDVSHHIGTTRMAEAPHRGVVDANCKVFGIDNLFVAGSSVFPTGGHVNPTMTIVALAIRLSERLKQVMVSLK